MIEKKRKTKSKKYSEKVFQFPCKFDTLQKIAFYITYKKFTQIEPLFIDNFSRQFFFLIGPYFWYIFKITYTVHLSMNSKTLKLNPMVSWFASTTHYNTQLYKFGLKAGTEIKFLAGLMSMMHTRLKCLKIVHIRSKYSLKKQCFINR